MTFQAALFDLDGVIFNTEPFYDIFWQEAGKRFRPDVPDLVQRIKGTTLTSTLDAWFSGPYEKCQEALVDSLNTFEASMAMNYIPGFEAFLEELQRKGIRTAVVTSSNQVKMRRVYETHPGFRSMFDLILTAEDFKEGKPSPECYLKAAEKLGVAPGDCAVFEDSRSGLMAARAAGAFVVGLVTTFPLEVVRPLSDTQIRDFTQAQQALFPED